MTGLDKSVVNVVKKKKKKAEEKLVRKAIECAANKGFYIMLL